jgi:hypothetical protein
LIRVAWAVLLCALLLPAVAGGEESVLDDLSRVEGQRDDELRTSLDKTHDLLSRRVVDLGLRLDRLFGGDSFEPDPRSHIRVSFTTLIEDDGVELEPRLRVRLALPNTERRLSLILESEDDRRFDRATGYEPAPPTLLRPEEGFTAGLRYLQRFANRFDLDADAGIRLRIPPDPFVRARIGRSFFVDVWELRLSEEAYWRYERGAGALSRFIAQRALAGPRFFRSATEVEWVNRDQRFHYAHDFILSHEFTPLNAVQTRIGARGESDPNQLTEWFVNIGWRRNIYKDWLFAEVRPELLFERERDFQAEPRLFLTLEAYFGVIERPETEVVPE